MANGFWNFLKNIHKADQKTKDVNSENYINSTPTEEQLNDNKNGNKAIILSIISCILLITLIALIVALFANNVVIGIFSIILLLIPSRLQLSAVKKAKKQLTINGKGKIKFLFVKYIIPIIAATASAIILFCLIGFFLK